ncbi:MAG: NfeD family protein [Gammaproteobacteria bacterium]
MTYWHWLIAAVVLIILEVFAPGAFFLWMSVAAGVVGLLLAVVPMPWYLQWLLFCVLSVASIFGWRAYKRANPDQDPYPNLNQRGQSLVGRRFTLSEPIVNERGKVNVDDSLWKVRGPDTPVGGVVVVLQVEGTELVVEPYQA